MSGWVGAPPMDKIWYYTHMYGALYASFIGMVAILTHQII